MERISTITEESAATTVHEQTQGDEPGRRGRSHPVKPSNDPFAEFARALRREFDPIGMLENIVLSQMTRSAWRMRQTTPAKAGRRASAGRPNKVLSELQILRKSL